MPVHHHMCRNLLLQQWYFRAWLEMEPTNNVDAKVMTTNSERENEVIADDNNLEIEEEENTVQKLLFSLNADGSHICITSLGFTKIRVVMFNKVVSVQ